MSLFLAILLAACCVLISVTGQGCLDGWNRYQDSCYVIGDTPVTWAVAQEICQDYNGKLAEIEDDAENTWVQDLARNENVQGCWLGATDVFDEGNWVWTSSGFRMFSFLDWSPGQPDEGGGEDCLTMWRESNYSWNDAYCSSILNFVCESEPAGAATLTPIG